MPIADDSQAALFWSYKLDWIISHLNVSITLNSNFLMIHVSIFSFNACLDSNGWTSIFDSRAFVFIYIQLRKIGIFRGNSVWSILVTYLALQINYLMECLSHSTEYKRQNWIIISSIALNLPLYLPTHAKKILSVKEQNLLSFSSLLTVLGTQRW